MYCDLAFEGHGKRASMKMKWEGDKLNYLSWCSSVARPLK